MKPVRLWDEALIRVALLCAVTYGEHGYAERPSDDQVLQAAMVVYTQLDWEAYNRRHGDPL